MYQETGARTSKSSTDSSNSEDELEEDQVHGTGKSRVTGKLGVKLVGNSQVSNKFDGRLADEEEFFDASGDLDQRLKSDKFQSTTVEPKRSHKSKVNSPLNGLADLAQVLQLSNGVTPSINALKTCTDDVYEWFNHFDLTARSCGWTEETKGIKLPVYLKKDAKQVWKSIPEIDQYDYATVKRTLLKELITEDSKSIARTSFFQASQTSSERPEDFGYRLRKLAGRMAMRLSEEDMVDRFISGLSDDIKLAVLSTRPKTLNEAIRFSGTVARHAVQGRRRGEINSVQTKPRRPSSSSDEDDADTISSVQSAKSSNHKVSFEQAGKGLVCHYCAETGHMKSECKLKKKAMMLIICRKCNLKGHYATRCPTTNPKDKASARGDQGRCQQ